MNKSVQFTPKTLTKKDFWLIYFLMFIEYCVALRCSKDKIAVSVIIAVSCVFPVLIFFMKILKKDISVIIINKYFGILGVYCAVISAVFLACQCGKSILKMIIIFVAVCAVIFIFIVALNLIFGRSMEKVKRHSIRRTVGYSIFAISGAAGIYSSRYLKIIGLDIDYEIILSLFCFVFTMFYSFTMRYRQLCKNESEQQNS